MENNVIIVLDLSNYKSEYQESVPFKAVITKKLESEIWVTSLISGKEYELYYSQILESLEMEEIIKLIDLSKYGT